MNCVVGIDDPRTVFAVNRPFRKVFLEIIEESGLPDSAAQAGYK
jgi:hypothetical protein